MKNGVVKKVMCSDQQCGARTLCALYECNPARTPGVTYAGTLKTAWVTHSAPCRYISLRVRVA